MLFIGLTLLGYISYQNLPVELIPNAELPILFVNVASPLEVDPKYMENEAVIPLEGVIGALEGVEEIESTASSRRGMIYISFSQKTNIKYAYLKLQERVEAIKPTLPEGFFVQVVKIDIEQLSNQFMGLQARGSGGTDRVRNVVEQEIKPELENLDGIASVEVFGGRQKSIEIILDEEACRAHGISPSQVRNQLSQSTKTKTFVGDVIENNRRYFVNVTAEYLDIEDLQNLVVDGRGPILLKDIADVFFGVKEETSYSRVNGKEAVTIQLVRDLQVNMIDLSHRTQEVIDQLNQQLQSKDVEIVIQSNMAETMEKNIDLIIRLALIGGLLAICLLWVFLKNLRLVVTVALAIPISVFTAFNFFYAFNISLNSLTLVGMALAIGMLLDNSVVVLENIYRIATRNKNADKAVIQGTKEVWRSIVAATLTTMAVFLPFLFAKDFFVSLLGKHVGVSIISTLAVSLLVALLLIPMTTHFFLKKKEVKFKTVSSDNRLVRIYIVLLKACMRFPARTIIGAIFLFFIAVFISLAISINSNQEVDTPEFNLYVTMPGGATLETTDYIVEQIENNVETLEEKQDVISKVYEEEAVVTINLLEEYKKTSDRSLAQIKRDIQDRVEDIRAAEISLDRPASGSRVGGMSGGGPGGGFERMLGIGSEEEKVVIKGQDFERMRNVAEDVRYFLESMSSVNSASMSISDNRPEIQINFDQQTLSQYGITLASIVNELNSFQNEFSSGIKFKQGAEEYDIIIKNSKTEEAPRKTIDDLKQLSIKGTSGSSYEMESLGEIIYATGNGEINRVNQEKHIEVRYRFIPEVQDSKSLLTASRLEIDDMVAAMPIPAGVAVEVFHEENDLSDFYFLILAAIILIYMIMAAVFESFSTPVVLMFSIPLAAIGSLIALILTGNSLFNANTLTGFLILLGVVVNNGIILIDYSRILQRSGYNQSRALMMAGLARIRPILITAVTTIVAMLPLAMGKAEYVTSIGAPFAVTVIGGLSLSTLLTLLFIPTFNTGLSNVLTWIKNLDWKIKAGQFAVFALLVVLIFLRIDRFIMKLLCLFLITILVPGLTYFVKTSLRQAKLKLIGDSDPILINIRSLVKVYDRDSRFIREWKTAQRKRKASGENKPSTTWQLFEDLIWQLPLLGFLLYFTYFYLESKLWFFILPHIVFLIFFPVWKPIKIFMQELSREKKKQFFDRLQKILFKLIYWGFPLLNLVLFQLRWDNIILVIFIALFWYLVLVIYAISTKIHRENINIYRLTGKFKRFRTSIYRLVVAIPLIGKRKKPFRALDGVTLEIGKGMFGLLGPNGAGKTTLMRVICGILEQSYGKITINGFDTQEKREELQGLIGYLPQEFGMYENMTAYEFLSYQALLKNLTDKDKREEMVNYVLASVHMDEHKNKKISSYSGGMKQRIGIAQILLHLPRILVVDEPTAGLDPRERIRFRNLLVELSRDRVVIFSTHIIEDIASSCNMVAVLDHGKLQYLGEPLKMAGIAEGHVWQFQVSSEDFHELQKKLLIVHHMQDGDQIRVRCVSDKAPVPNAKPVKALLEDSYLYLLKGKNDK